MYLSQVLANKSTEAGLSSVHLECGQSSKPEKNGIAFTISPFTSEADERMYFVQRIVPHTIVVEGVPRARATPINGSRMTSRRWWSSPE